MAQASLLPEIIPPFQFQNFPIRTKVEEGNLWFVAKDVCAALGILWTGATLKGIHSNWKGMLRFNTPSGNQQLKCISEPAVYKLAFRSNKPEADEFTNWVASEVLPSIHTTGKFDVCNTLAAEKQAQLSSHDALPPSTSPIIHHYLHPHPGTAATPSFYSCRQSRHAAHRHAA